MKYVLFSVAVVAVVGAMAWAQAPVAPEPIKERQWLRQFVGEWSSTSTSTAMAGHPAVECSGLMTSRMLGELWVVNEMEAEVQGVAFRGLQTIGYDAAKKKYVGTWVDSMIPHLWQYEGTVDASGNKLILLTEGPNFTAEGAISKYRDSYEFKSQDHVIVASEMMGATGDWTTIMTGEMKRK